jgi:hypothetical protein
MGLIGSGAGAAGAAAATGGASIPWTAIAGGASLLGGLLGQSEPTFNIKNNQTAYNRSAQFADPNSSLYGSASRGFYNRLINAIPSTSNLLTGLAAQGINSPTVAAMQRNAALKRAGTEAANYESDLFGRFQGIGAQYLQQYYNNQQFEQSGQAQYRNTPYQSLANLGGGLLGYQLGGLGR